MVEKTGERRDEAEVHRLKGVLVLRSKASAVQDSKPVRS